MRAKRVRAERGTVPKTAAVAREDIRHGVCRTCGKRRMLTGESRVCLPTFDVVMVGRTPTIRQRNGGCEVTA